MWRPRTACRSAFAVTGASSSRPSGAARARPRRLDGVHDAREGNAVRGPQPVHDAGRRGTETERHREVNAAGRGVLEGVARCAGRRGAWRGDSRGRTASGARARPRGPGSPRGSARRRPASGARAPAGSPARSRASGRETRRRSPGAIVKPAARGCPPYPTKSSLIEWNAATRLKPCGPRASAAIAPLRGAMTTTGRSVSSARRDATYPMTSRGTGTSTMMAGASEATSASRSGRTRTIAAEAASFQRALSPTSARAPSRAFSTSVASRMPSASLPPRPSDTRPKIGPSDSRTSSGSGSRPHSRDSSRSARRPGRSVAGSAFRPAATMDRLSPVTGTLSAIEPTAASARASFLHRGPCQPRPPGAGANRPRRASRRRSATRRATPVPARYLYGIQGGRQFRVHDGRRPAEARGGSRGGP